MAIPFLACLAFVSQLYDLPPRVLPSIQAVEGGGIGVVHRNTDGSEDMGVMQINTTWLPTLARYSQQSIPEVRHQLLTSPCYNISAAGMILHGYLKETGGDLMQAIGNYNSHTPIHNHVYQVKVMRSVTRLVDQLPTSRSAEAVQPLASRPLPKP
ncbi:MAG: lytic transglycosylase domain-containing protein [Janthinobacterium lividum]